MQICSVRGRGPDLVQALLVHQSCSNCEPGWLAAGGRNGAAAESAVLVCRCGNPTGCCDLQGGCQLGSLTGMSPFGTCLLQYDATLGPSNARNAPGVNYRYQPSDVLNWTDDATKCKSFTSGACVLNDAWQALGNAKN